MHLYVLMLCLPNPLLYFFLHSVFLLLLLIIIIMEGVLGWSVCVCECEHTTARVDGRELLSGVGSLLPLWDLGFCHQACTAIAFTH